MAPNTKGEDFIRQEPEDEAQLEKLVPPQAGPRKYEVKIINVITFGYWHLAGLYGLYLCFTSAKWQTIVLAYIFLRISILGITAGVHRLWTHRSYKAKLPLEILLMLFNSISFQDTAMHWVRDHRLHHKYSDTDADPHNATRGLFYSQIGWLFVRKHEEVKRRGKFIDMSDIYSNPVLQFQRKYALPLITTVCFIIPTVIPMYFWGESFNNAWHVNIFRYVSNLHVTFLVNSIAHAFGSRPYDKNILPAENVGVALITLGEGFHNYHHVFPWDYRTAEMGNNMFNFTTLFINFFAWIGWAYDLKSVPDEIIKARAKRTGERKDYIDAADEMSYEQVMEMSKKMAEVKQE